ncbi:hypothetical protein V1525DRAFT_454949 [Lipomyces kononenkoae]|uniref:Uncharacterized protein n=1 Tax=Lipomyces kononenkoae TaxID=34357 RepID=A0ACC3T7U3_LIPKO
MGQGATHMVHMRRPTSSQACRLGGVSIVFHFLLVIIHTSRPHSLRGQVTPTFNTAGTEALNTALLKAPASTAAGALKQRPALTSGGTVPGSITAPVTSTISTPLTTTTATAAATTTRKLPTKSRKAITAAPKTKPAFVLKLWNMVNDQKNSAHINWMPDGLSFQVVGREQFEKTVLPKYFKHSNFSSFVRQLNMYGWHKVQDVTAGAMQSGEETWQFKSPNFIRGREDLLDNIVRNRGSKGSDEDEEFDLHQILEEVEIIRQSQQVIAEQLKHLKQDNELLWSESYQTRERHKNFSDTLEKVLRFLASVYGNPSKILGSSDGIPGVDSPHPNKRARLMLRDADDRSPILELPESSASSNGQIQLTTSGDLVSSLPALSASTISSNSPVSVANSGATISPIQANPAMFDQSNFLDSFPMDAGGGASPNATTPRPFFPDLLASPPSGSTPASTSSPNNMMDANPRQAINNFSTAEPDQTMNRIADNSRTLESLSHELDLQGQSLDQVEEWIQKNLSSYSPGQIDFNEFLH